MLTLVAGRLASGVVTLFVLTAAIHALVAIAPGDPLVALLGPAAFTVPEQEKARMRADLGLDRPWPAQVVSYLGGAVRGDLGTSRRSGRPVAAELRERFPFSLALAAAALPLATIIGLVAVTAAAARARSWVDAVVTGAVVMAAAVPTYWTALLALLAFSLVLGWFPSSGAESWRHGVLPVVTLAVASAAPLARVTRGAVLDAMSQPHVTAAHARGLAGRSLLLRHGLRNAMLPIVTVIGLDLGRVLGGALFIEVVFGWPGLGRLMVDATLARDLPLVMGGVIVAAASVIVANLLVDLAYLRLDPRVRYR